METIHTPPPSPASGVPAPFAALRNSIAGSLHEPGSNSYVALATPWNTAVATRPAAVLEAATAVDVVVGGKFAAAHNLAVAVQATGHGIASDLDGALLIHTRSLDECSLATSRDPHGSATASTGAGVTWKTVLSQCEGPGLATLCGSAPGASVAGYTSGGGIGPMVRTFGAASDKVRSFTQARSFLPPPTYPRYCVRGLNGAPLFPTSPPPPWRSCSSRPCPASLNRWRGSSPSPSVTSTQETRTTAPVGLRRCALPEPLSWMRWGPCLPP